MSLALTLLLVQPPAYDLAGDATAWERVREDSGSTWFIDPASLRRDGDTVLIRSRSDHPAEISTGETRTLVVTFLFDCRAETYSFQRVESYRADGTLIHVFDFAENGPPPEAHPIVDNDDPVHRRICGDSPA